MNASTIEKIAAVVGIAIACLVAGYFQGFINGARSVRNDYREARSVLEESMRVKDQRIELWKQAYDDCNNSRTNIIETLKGMKL